ncbi:hypothetical protein CA235_07365 [Sphingomonas sp. ABOLF]|nr:hypothetical protein CA235_07365 [Sphingomonas sp. ABOLF]
MHPNDDWTHNPIFAGRDPTRALTSYVQPEQPKKPNVPPAVGRIIGELGLRYRPSAQADLEAHAMALKLLTEDVADVPVSLLEKAAKLWVRENRFMPKAAELIALAREAGSDTFRGTNAAVEQLEDHCARLNQLDWCRGQWRVVKTNEGHHTVERVTARAAVA